MTTVDGNLTSANRGAIFVGVTMVYLRVSYIITIPIMSFFINKLSNCYTNYIILFQRKICRMTLHALTVDQV